MKKLWFKAKIYGYGWYPATWEGWLAILVWLAAVLIGMRTFAGAASDDPTNFWLAVYFIAYLCVLTAALIILCVKKGEKAGWRWGKPKEPREPKK